MNSKSLAISNMEKSEQVEIVRHSEVVEELLDSVAIEEPLQITIDGFPVAVVMRTVGDDEDLVRGFLVTEGIIDSVEDISRIDLEQKVNHALVFLGDDVEVDLGALKRNLYSASSCGICGKASIEAVFLKQKPIKSGFLLEREVLAAAPDKLRVAQETFAKTGGLHAAGIFSQDGELLIAKEDVGRHNAIDKVIGNALLDQINLSDTFLQVSGRVSFEVVQKALMAGIPAVTAISAPTSLAVNFARESGMLLVGFMKKNSLNVYSGTLKTT